MSGYPLLPETEEAREGLGGVSKVSQSGHVEVKETWSSSCKTPYRWTDDRWTNPGCKMGHTIQCTMGLVARTGPGNASISSVPSSFQLLPAFYSSLFLLRGGEGQPSVFSRHLILKPWEGTPFASGGQLLPGFPECQQAGCRVGNSAGW